MVYWVKDLTEKLLPTYDNATQGTRNGYPAYAELQIRNMGKSYEGFAAGYAGVYEVTEVREVKTVHSRQERITIAGKFRWTV